MTRNNCSQDIPIGLYCSIIGIGRSKLQVLRYAEKSHKTYLSINIPYLFSIFIQNYSLNFRVYVSFLIRPKPVPL